MFTTALYLQADKTGSTLFHTLTEKEKSEIISLPLDYRFMKNSEKLALIERISRHPSITDKLPADINYLGGISGTGMYTAKRKPGQLYRSQHYEHIKQLLRVYEYTPS